MKVTYKNILVLQSFQEAIAKFNLSSEDYVVIAKINKTVKKLADNISDFQESVEDLRLDNCYKEGSKIVRENGQLQWSAEGEKAFRKAYKQLLNEEVEVNVEPINYSELFDILPKEAQANNKWEDVEEALTPFFINK
jgi:hypothetical protein